jgi:serine protease SohB
MDLLNNYFLFLAKSMTVVISIVLIIVAVAQTKKTKKDGKLYITKLNDKYHEIKRELEEKLLSKKELKNKIKADKKANKQLKKNIIDSEQENIFLLNFKGDISASPVNKLQEEVSAILNVAKTQDEVVLKLESSGGAVNGYGLAAAQLARIREKGIKLTICIDKVAASGGYLMAVTANQILAAPFSVIGSVGVITFAPNINRLLKKLNIDVEEHAAGEYKKSISLFGEVTPKAREKLQETLEEIHHYFKQYIMQFRPNIDIDKIATGEYWLASKAIKLNLIDELKTSEAYLLEKSKTVNIFELSYETKKTLRDKIAKGFMSLQNFGV